jgi:hypothetical protein
MGPKLHYRHPEVARAGFIPKALQWVPRLSAVLFVLIIIVFVRSFLSYDEFTLVLGEKTGEVNAIFYEGQARLARRGAMEFGALYERPSDAMIESRPSHNAYWLYDTKIDAGKFFVVTRKYDDGFIAWACNVPIWLPLMINLLVFAVARKLSSPRRKSAMGSRPSAGPALNK